MYLFYVVDKIGIWSQVASGKVMWATCGVDDDGAGPVQYVVR